MWGGVGRTGAPSNPGLCGRSCLPFQGPKTKQNYVVKQMRLVGNGFICMISDFLTSDLCKCEGLIRDLFSSQMTVVHELMKWFIVHGSWLTTKKGPRGPARALGPPRGGLGGLGEWEETLGLGSGPGAGRFLDHEPSSINH